MLEAVAASLPMAVGLAASPVPVAGVATLLLSRRPGNAWAFVLGWVLGILAVGLVVSLIPGLDTGRGEPTRLSGWLRLLLGGVLLLLARQRWQGRPAPDDPVEAPAAIARLDAIGPASALGLAFVFSAINPKNLVLTFAASASIYAYAVGPSAQAGALVVYTLIASVGVILPTVAHTLFAEQVQPTLVTWKDWILRNEAVLVGVLLVVFAALLASDGLQILAG